MRLWRGVVLTKESSRNARLNAAVRAFRLRLSPRENQVLDCLLSRWGIGDITEEFGIGAKGAQKHVTRIRKLAGVPVQMRTEQWIASIRGERIRTTPPKPCSECPRKAIARGLCQRHWLERKKYGRLLTDAEHALNRLKHQEAKAAWCREWWRKKNLARAAGQVKVPALHPG